MLFARLKMKKVRACQKLKEKYVDGTDDCAFYLN